MSIIFANFASNVLECGLKNNFTGQPFVYFCKSFLYHYSRAQETLMSLLYDFYVKPNEKLMHFSILKRVLFTVVTLIIAVSPALAQDMIARQAPVDRKMKAVDTLALKDLIHREQAASPAQDLYEDWNNIYAHKATQLPDSFLVDLRHYCMPTPSRVVTSNFGARWGRQHKGIDIKVYIGDTIRSAFSGKVRMVKYEAAGYGHYIVIRHNNGLETIYAHLSKPLVDENETVRAGDVIGLGGNTGRSTGSHLHFETRICGVAINPAILFDFRNQDVVADSYMFRSNTYKDESAEANRLRGKVGNGGYTREQVTGEAELAATEAVKTIAAETRYHKVRKGETLASIAKKYGMSVQEICRMNRISKSKRIKAGQILRCS